MTILSRNHIPLLLGFLFVVSLILVWLLRFAGAILVTILLVLSFALASFAAIQKNRAVYHQGNITRTLFIRNTVIDLLGILLAMVLASLLGEQIAQMATQQIDDVLIKSLAGIVVGLLVGLVTGFIIKRVWGQLVRVR